MADWELYFHLLLHRDETSLLLAKLNAALHLYNAKGSGHLCKSVRHDLVVPNFRGQRYLQNHHRQNQV